MRLLLIDDDQQLTQMLSEYLAKEGFDCTVIAHGEQAVTLIKHQAFDVVVLDIMLPGIGGLEVLQAIRAESRIPVLMLTARGGDIDRVLGLEMGADDYLPKPCFPRELLARLKAVLRRTHPGSEHVQSTEFNWDTLQLNTAKRTVTLQGKPLELTATEFNVLELMLRNPQRVLTKEELTEKILGRPWQQYDRSIDVHISNVRQKLAAQGATQDLFDTVRGVGYRLRNPR